MAAPAVVPMSEYLSHTYEPDCDFVEGELEERNAGEELHSELQNILASIFHANRHAWSIRSLTEQRVQLGLTASAYLMFVLCPGAGRVAV